jgi:hypothetical protein
MGNIRSRPLNAPPLDRAMLDSAASPMRVFFGIVFLAWSWISTVVVLGAFLAPAVPGDAAGIPARYIVALVFAILITAVEFVSASRWAPVYWLVLLAFDAPFTTIQTHAWGVVLTAPYLAGGVVTSGADAMIWLVSVVAGVIAAILGELLLFGRR